MATPINNVFTTYSLTSEELLTGSQLHYLQKCCIQNQIAQIATQKLALKFNPGNVNEFLQIEAELQGQLNALQYLITLSDAADTNSPHTS